MGISAKNSLAGAALAIGAPLALWGLMGQQNDETAAPSDLTYTIEPVRALEDWATELGAAGLVMTVVSALHLVRATRSGALDPRRWFVLLPLTAAGVVAAGSHRVLTAGTADANIGAGLAMFFGTPAAAGLLLWALIQTIRLRARSPRRTGPATC